MIDVYVKDIKCCLVNKCYFAALSLALTLPDICGRVEFPKETSVARRYIGWYDKYLDEFMKQGHVETDGKTPWISGEIVYNLRNTYLHQGEPNVIGSKVKEGTNQLDRFVMVLGDGTVIQTVETSIDLGQYVSLKEIFVDITFLCETLCNCALRYYEEHKECFFFNFHVIMQEDIKEATEVEPIGDIVKIMNDKLSECGYTMRIERK